MIGVLRSLGVAAIGGGLVLGIGHLGGPLDLARPADQDLRTEGRVGPVVQARPICPGPEALGIAGVKDSPSQIVSVVAATAPVQALPPGLVAPQAPGSLAITGLPRGGAWAPPVTTRGLVASAVVSTPKSALVHGSGALAPGTVAAQRSWVKVGDDRSLVTAACLPAAASSWLVAGGADPGRRVRLVLTNPGPNPVTVDVDVLGVKGLIKSPNGHGLVVGPVARSVVVLDAIAGTEPSPVVHVAARGGEVAAVLNDTWLDGVVPRGGDDAVPMAGPSREQVIPGLQLGGGHATLRIAVPGDRDAVVESRVLTPSGPKALPSNGVTHLKGQTSRDIDLSALPPDAYAVQVRADVPVVAAAMVERRKVPDGPSELAWSTASTPITTVAGMALREPGEKTLLRRLDLAATTDPASILVTTVGDDGQVRSNQVAMSADSVTTLGLDGATSVWVTHRTGVVHASVMTWVSDADGMLWSVAPLSNLALTVASAPLLELRD